MLSSSRYSPLRSVYDITVDDENIFSEAFGDRLTGNGAMPGFPSGNPEEPVRTETHLPVECGQAHLTVAAIIRPGLR